MAWMVQGDAMMITATVEDCFVMIGREEPTGSSLVAWGRVLGCDLAEVLAVAQGLKLDDCENAADVREHFSTARR